MLTLSQLRGILASCLVSLCLFNVRVVLAAELPSNLIKLEIRRSIDSRLANIHLACNVSLETNRPDDDLDFHVTYGACNSIVRSDAHHNIGGTYNLRDISGNSALRLVWVVPEDTESHGCLSAWSQSSLGQLELVGRSSRLLITKEHRHWQVNKRNAGNLTKRTSESMGKVAVKMTNASGIDAQGPWMDGVELLKDKEIGMVDVRKAKSKRIAIVGAGMSGLMTWLCLNSSGFNNIEILEAGERLGGRVHTEYLQGGPFDYQYQEMGPMRFPVNMKYVGHENETLPINDMKLVFQLASKLNNLNGFERNFSVDFIPWIQSSPNGLSYFNGIKKKDGRPPTVSEVQKHPKKYTIERPDNKQLDLIAAAYANITSNPKILAEAATNMYKAHKKFLDVGLNGLGGDEWSEYAFLHNYLKFGLNITDYFIDEDGISSFGSSAASFWDDIYDSEYFGAVDWRTIDGGLNRLPYAFYPLVGNITKMSHQVSQLEYDDDAKKVTLSWSESFPPKELHKSTYDYAIVAAPFSVVRYWRFPNTLFNPTKASAIRNVPYQSACKVALQFQTRFWEHLDKPIIGSCSTNTDIPGIGNICYPSYNLHADGPGVMLASYIPGGFSETLVSLTEAEHVQYVLDSIIEIHGEVAKNQYTGRFARRCWTLDPLQKGAWTQPLSYMHELYIPEYFKTENNIVFVGEHTSFTHAWIASALESGVRGSVQLMLELGLVDEAKATTEEWMGRWISV